jgi:predicted NUDIX family NTP pyrophosphohydrolase
MSGGRLAAGACKNRPVTFEAATERLIELARKNGGVLTAGDVEADAELAAAQETVSAAAHALAGSTNVFASSGESSWFPYDEIRFTDLH